MDIFNLMLFIWFIGWGIACGRHSYICDDYNKNKELATYLLLLFIWPHYIGYR